MHLKNAQQIAAWRLCVGCGACSYICPRNYIALRDVTCEGIRPVLRSVDCGSCTDCVDVCPGYNMDKAPSSPHQDQIPGLRSGWGQILEVWEGYAADPQIRYQGSSGGVASALSLYCLEQERMHGVLHVGPDSLQPCTNRTMLSRSRSEVIGKTGSRYAPASPCDGLGLIESAPGPCVFVGKPCDARGLKMARALRPGLDSKVGLSVGIFCAGTPSTQGTLDLLDEVGVKPDEVEQISYRGRGWPGKFSVRVQGEREPRELLTYHDAWGFVQKYRPYRCYLCPDGTSEAADIACGDPWYRPIEEGEQGRSLVLVRTDRGRTIIRRAIDAGYLRLERAAPEILTLSQKNLLAKRGAIWGRLLALRAFGIPTPRLRSFPLFPSWLAVPAGEKIRSIAGTARRIMKRKYYRPSPY